MKIGDLSRGDLGEKLASNGIRLRIGPFSTHLQTSLPRVVASIQLLYSDFSLEDREGVADFHARLTRPWGSRRWLRPQVFFHVDGKNLFEPFPLALAPPLFEWGLNWCISSRAHQFPDSSFGGRRTGRPRAALAGTSGLREEHTLRRARSSRLSSSFRRTRVVASRGQARCSGAQTDCAQERFHPAHPETGA